MSVVAPPRAYSSEEVCRLAGISYRQLDSWIRTGYITPSVKQTAGSGDPRRFAREDVARTRMTKRLLDIGVSWERLRRDGDPYKTADRMMAAMMRMGSK